MCRHLVEIKRKLLLVTNRDLDQSRLRRFLATARSFLQRGPNFRRDGIEVARSVEKYSDTGKGRGDLGYTYDSCRLQLLRGCENFA